MITFLRKIRERLLTENKFSKYLLYAFGEIILVVIGILIALQINNQNNIKIETKELHSFLNNIKNNMEADLIGLEEIKIFRDSSVFYSRKYLSLADQNWITVEDYNATRRGRYGVFIDRKFKAHSSGFEALKNSGYIGKLNGTSLEQNLNEYYYILDKINEREESLINTTESMQIAVFNDNIRQRLLRINNMENLEKYVTRHQKEIKSLLNHPSVTGANVRNAAETLLPTCGITCGPLAASRSIRAHVMPHVSWPPGAHSAGRQAPRFEMEPVTPNDSIGVFPRSSTVACGLHLANSELASSISYPACNWPLRDSMPHATSLSYIPAPMELACS